MKPDDGLSKLTKQVIYGLNHGLFDDELGQVLLENWGCGIADAKIRGHIDHRTHRHQFKLAMRRSPFAELELRRGNMVLGLDIGDETRQIRIPAQYVNGHSLTVSTTGGGKTTKSRFYALQLAALVVGVWLFDLRKREWRVLREYMKRMDIDLTVVPGRLMRLNPLQVPYMTDPADWAANVADMLVVVFKLPPRAGKLIQTSLFRLYRQFGVFDGATQYPTLFDLFEAVKADKDANPQSRMAIIDSLEPVLHSLGPKVLGYRYGWTTHEMAKHCLAFELAGLAEVDKNLLLNSLLLSEFASRISQGQSNVPMDLWICVDEAQRVCAASDQSSTSAINESIGLIRGAGIGLDLSVQSTDMLSPHVVSNTNVKMLGRCGSYADVASAGRCMGLNSDQVCYVQQSLQTGYFVCQLGEGSFRQPFLCRIPEMKLSTGTGRPGDLGPLKALPVA